ncbi:MAG: AAA family ATPase [Eubacteriales bacterium]|nr:AAA family ATPase [Eubacteriales bacterium]
MDRFHFSTAQCFENCPARFDFRYNQNLDTLPPDNADNPLLLGTALHRGMEVGMKQAIQEYKNAFPIITDLHVNEIIKLEYWIPKMRELLPEGLHEVNFKNDVYEGTADLLVPVENGQFDLYDFKYSNNIEHYMLSNQLHVYKYFLHRTKGIKVRNMFFVFVPKVQIKQKKTETIQDFRNRIFQELESKEIQVKEVKYNPNRVENFMHTCMKIGLTRNYKKSVTYLCDWCEYKDYCREGLDYMLLPSAERRQISKVTKRKLWIYGGSFSGKTTFMDKAPSPLNLNTDGNIQFVTMPYLAIKDKMEGRQRILAWKVFKDAIDELEKTAGQNGFKTIIVDLLEDTYESCRLFMYDKLGITHESDDSFRAWDKVRTEFLSTMRKVFNLDYENIVVISHEDTSKDITKKTGDKITSIKPNINDKVASKIAGMVDIVARVVVEDDESRTLNFKSNEVIFGGGRLKNIQTTSCPLDWDELLKVYDEANFFEEGAELIREDETKPDEEVEEPEETEQVEEEPAKPARTSRRTRKER